MFNYELENSEYDNLEDCVNDVYHLAVEYAIDGVKNNVGGPFGAGIILRKDNGRYIILAIDRNSVIRDNDPTAHAEVNAIRKACKLVNNKFLENCILVTTAKSCPMCLSAACWAKIKTVYYSESYDNAVTSGFKDDDIYQYLNGNNPELIEEKQLINDKCVTPFEVWNKKIDRIQY